MKNIYHAYNYIMKRVVCIILALILVILSLLDCLGRASSFIARQKDTEASALELELTTSALYYILLSLGYSVDSLDSLGKIANDMYAADAFLSEDWRAIKIDDGVITQQMVDDYLAYAGETVNPSVADQLLIERNMLSCINPGAAMLIASSGYSEQAKTVKRFYLKETPYSSSIGYSFAQTPDNVIGIIITSPKSWFYLLADGSLISSSESSFSSGSLKVFDMYSEKDAVSFYDLRYYEADTFSYFFNNSALEIRCNSSNAYYFYGTKYGTIYDLYGLSIWPSIDSFNAKEQPIPSNPTYGVPIDLFNIAAAGATAGFMERIIGKSLPLDQDSIAAMINAGTEAAEKARSKAKEEGKDDAAAEEDAAVAAADAISLALDKLSGDINDGNKGILGLLGMILAALTGTYAGQSLFSLVKDLAEELSAYIKKMIDGTVFVPIVSAILSTPTGIIGSLDALPDAIGRVIHTVLTGLGLEDVFGKAIDSALDWVKDIPGNLSGAIDNALDWMKAIPGNLSGAIDNALDWGKDIPGSIAGAISDGLSWILSLPDTIADAITDALERLRDLGIEIPSLDWILDWLTLDVFTITNAMAAVRAIALEKLGLPAIDPFKSFGDPLAIDYPIIKMPTPDILRQFYKQNYIILIDFSDYQQYCQTARTLLRGICWFSFLLFIIKSHKVNLNIA